MRYVRRHHFAASARLHLDNVLQSHALTQAEPQCVRLGDLAAVRCTEHGKLWVTS